MILLVMPILEVVESMLMPISTLLVMIAIDEDNYYLYILSNNNSLKIINLVNHVISSKISILVVIEHILLLTKAPLALININEDNNLPSPTLASNK